MITEINEPFEFYEYNIQSMMHVQSETPLHNGHMLYFYISINDELSEYCTYEKSPQSILFISTLSVNGSTDIKIFCKDDIVKVLNTDLFI